MAYKCICGTYVVESLQLCPQCKTIHGGYNDWPEWVNKSYFDLNFGGDYRFSELDKLGRPGSIKAAPLGKPGDILKGVQDPQLGELSGKRCPVCQARIKPKERLCKKCFATYGSDKKQWPEWLAGKFIKKQIDGKWQNKWLDGIVTMNQAEADAARDHKELSIDDETALSKIDPTRPGGEGYKTAGSVGGRTYAQFNPDEMSREALDWGDDELGGSDNGALEPGAIAGDRTGHKYNAAAWRGSGIQTNNIGVFWERDLLDEKIARDQELEKFDCTRQIVILLYGAGHKQREIAELLGIDQQRVSDILTKPHTKQP